MINEIEVEYQEVRCDDPNEEINEENEEDIVGIRPDDRD